MSRIRPQPTRQTKQNNIFSHKDLDTCSHVFVRKDFVKRALSPPYEGPFPVVSRSSKTFTVKINDQNKVISVNRLKPAFIENTPQSFHDSSILPPMPDGAEETTPKTSADVPEFDTTIFCSRNQEAGVLRAPAKLEDGDPCADAFRMLTVAYEEATLDRSNVYRWYKMFSEGQEDVNDEERAGRLSTSTTDEKINEVEKMILANR
ncbi:hypothetical protein LAZ67_20001671 [Cordylochernes scorpioides]|uniref:Mos1 transposase HTH domain-containing protein n=1 Tax=Cordylochernes scorpioides TaxID=51811 RepID=A0ABY6LMQ0_9ARAC|nr:hypothetical protein LAZ67_20001671 [Cordylochernes scorpioides]